MTADNTRCVVADEAYKNIYCDENTICEDKADLSRVNDIFLSSVKALPDRKIFSLETISNSWLQFPPIQEDLIDGVLVHWADMLSAEYLASLGGKPYPAVKNIKREYCVVSGVSGADHSSKGDREEDLIRMFTGMLMSIPFRNSWREEGIAPPTNVCEKKSISYAKNICMEHGLTPSRIAPSIEEGVMLVYYDRVKSRSLNIEIYNSNEVAGLVNEKKSILLCIDVQEEENDVSKLVKTFKE